MCKTVSEVELLDISFQLLTTGRRDRIDNLSGKKQHGFVGFLMMAVELRRSRSKNL